MAKKKMSKKKFRIVWNSILSVLLVIVLAANVALYYFSDVITSYFSTIDLDSAEAVKARESSELVAEQIADEGIVLLQNDENALPLDTSEDSKTKVNVFGWSFTNPIYGGTGSGSSDASTAVTPKAGLEAAGFEVNEQLYNAYVDTGIKRPLVGMDGQDWSIPEPKPSDFYTDELMQQAKDFSDVAIIFLARSGGEGADLPRTMDGPDTFDPDGGSFGATGQKFGYEDDLDASKHYLELSNREQGMIDAVTQNFNNVILVVNSANTFELGWVDQYDQIKSVLNVAGPGQNGFNSLGKVLSGEVNPSGRTVDLYPKDLLDSPAIANFGDFDYVIENNDGTYSQAVDSSNVLLKYVDYSEGIYVGYRFYETAATLGAINYDEKVQYPFGYGLSYTSFEQEVVPNSLNWTDTEVTVDVKVTNTGSVEGKDVVQLYFTAPYTGKIEKSSIDLAAFEKTNSIKPGESETVTLTFNVEDMASYDANKQYSDTGSYVLEAGEYKLMLMNNSHEKIADVGSKNLTEIVYDSTGRSTDKQVAVNQFDDEVTGEGSITTYLSRANNFANLTDINKNEIYTVTTSEGSTKEVKGKLVDSEFVSFINSSRYDVPADTNDKAPITGADNGKQLKDYTGLDINDESWDQLLDQLTVDDLVNLATLGGYRTLEIDSVGKPGTLDYDGPAAINNMNMAANGQSGTAFPSEIMIASTWNLELAEAMGEHVGAEAKAYGVTGWYAPAMNIHRTAFAGRNFEYYSEDGLLSGKMAAAVTKGFQSQGGYVYIKHFALNDQETNRTFGVLTWSNEQAIREIYLKPFEIAVKEGGAKAVMSSFNSIGNTWAGADNGLLKEVLRNEWGFAGHVITDFYMNGGGLNAYPYMNVELALRNGNDLMLTGAAPMGVPEVNTSSNDTLWALRDAAHNILYNTANSIAIEGDLSSEMPQWVIITIIIDALLVLGFATAFFFVFRNSKKREEIVDSIKAV
ncbi:glycoside hydrolase family 3 C-terminal domain-containing protein [Caldibacillus lycopersici]|uniref:Glycoside hydrolase family 3 C-terminal domain-containing protein n=1 Tax=Perspicuibacillus lycopersici TaxID=1325689 RepID=A0AAE3IYG8_9BACI|nr:glycoside hydrolase family 3 protein [Perspicuibacillus lycopersici]MCU9614370.1 glycoside hydrolase family 3 C-terminal domain-containing protein [Perspicuibacillus lycopersici]